MITPTNDKQITYAFLVTFFLYLALRVLGAFLLENNWSFTHLFYIPIWYYAVPIVICASLFYFTHKENNFSENLLDNRLNKILLFGFFFLLFIIFQFDSFLYGGGNYKINQIAQTENIIYRFYEFGSVFVVSLFYNLFSLFDLKQNTAGVVSWKLFSYLGAALTFVASLLLSKTISENKKNRFLIFLIIFFGPQTISYFGFVGNTTIITASIYFFIYFGLQFGQNKSFSTLAVLWLVTLISIFMHISLLLLVPPLLFVTFYKIISRKKIAFILSLTSYAALTFAVFWIASSNFEYMKQILFVNNHNMHARYNLLSLAHISDFLQLLLLFVPQIIIVKFLFFKRFKEMFKSYQLQLITLVVLPATTLAFILEPTHSIILDAPIFAVYLSPIVLLMAMLLSQSHKNLKYAAVFSLLVPLMTLPSYIQIDTAEKQIESYLQDNQHFFIEGSTALQDSYFYSQELDKANYWYINLPKVSRDFLDLTAAGEFSYAEMYPEAMRLYYQLKTKSPFWGEPRFQIAAILIKQRSFQLARAELDTCLMIAPYEKEYLKLDYAYYRTLGDFNKVEKKVLYALEVFPKDYDIQTDLAVAYYRLRDIKKADSTAAMIIKNDTSQAFAYLIRGFAAEINKQPNRAIEFFKKFIKLAPNEPETPEIRKRLNNLIISKQEN